GDGRDAQRLARKHLGALDQLVVDGADADVLCGAVDGAGAEGGGGGGVVRVTGQGGRHGYRQLGGARAVRGQRQRRRDAGGGAAFRDARRAGGDGHRRAVVVGDVDSLLPAGGDGGGGRGRQRLVRERLRGLLDEPVVDGRHGDVGGGRAEVPGREGGRGGGVVGVAGQVGGHRHVQAHRPHRAAGI